MLEEISINNLGIIKTATLPFTDGLTVITGETGAGKTMVLSALHLLLGRRSDTNMIGQNSNTLTVEGCWNVQNTQAIKSIKETGAVIEDDQLFINRTVQTGGKSRAVIGGKTTPASVLSEIGLQLVNIHGQSDQIRLKNTAAQRDALDTYAGEKLSKTLTNYKNAYNQLRKKKKLIEDIKKNSFARKREIATLEEFIKEFDELSPIIDEDIELTKEIATLSNIDTIRLSVAEALESITPTSDEIPSITGQLNNAVRVLAKVAEYDKELSELSQKLAIISDDLDNATNDIENYSDNLDEDSLARLYEAQERLSNIKLFIRKYGNSLNSVIEERDAAQEKLDNLQELDQPLDVLEDELEELSEKIANLAEKITELRTTAAKQLSEKVNEELSGLSMSSSEMIISIVPEKLTSKGKDEVEFLLRTGGQNNPRPIAKSASGGELSRIMLALEVVLADPKTTPTFVFDEVDSGVGGTAAIEIGKRLAKLAKEAQVIVVTHLPQVAAFSDNHLNVIKTSSNEYTETSVQQLDDDQRIKEMTRMLSGMTNSDTGHAHATDLINLAKNYKKTL